MGAMSMPDKPNDEAAAVDGSRRAFLAGAGAAAVAGLTATACSTTATGKPDLASTNASAAGATASAPQPAASQPSVTQPAVGQTAASTVAFGGTHQAGVLLDPAPAGLVAAFDVVTTDRAELVDTLQRLSVEVERLMANRPPEQADEFLPPVDSGIIDADTGTAGVAITMAVGASLFDDRFGLADRRPRELIAMPRFFNDGLVRSELSDGDLSLTISAPNQQAAVFALHQAVRVSGRRLRLRWVQEGYNQLLPDRPGQIAPARNLMGFRDGTSNLDTGGVEQMQQHVWVQVGDDEPDWAVGGSYQASRVIRMLLEFWATAALVRQEQIFGRHRDTGAPLGQLSEADEPAFATDPDDVTIPQRAHTRLANPRTPGTGQILRRGFSYLNGADANGELDQGLLFVCYQRSLASGFLDVQSRLNGEPLEDYIKPVGGGLFFVLPGPGDGVDRWLGRTLFDL